MSKNPRNLTRTNSTRSIYFLYAVDQKHVQDYFILFKNMPLTYGVRCKCKVYGVGYREQGVRCGALVMQRLKIG